MNEFDNKFRIIGDEKRDEEDELSKHVAPETVFEVVHKLLIEQCEDTDFLLQLKRYILDYIIDKIHLINMKVNTYPKTANILLHLTEQKFVQNQNSLLPTGFTGTV